MMNVDELVSRHELVMFIKDVQKAFAKDKKFDGVYMCHLYEDYYFVMASGRDDETNDFTLFGKVAYNCDDLQCDYDWDWYMPYTDDGDVYDSEFIACEGYDAKDLCTQVIDVLCGIVQYAHIPDKA